MVLNQTSAHLSKPVCATSEFVAVGLQWHLQVSSHKTKIVVTLLSQLGNNVPNCNSYVSQRI